MRAVEEEAEAEVHAQKPKAPAQRARMRYGRDFCKRLR